MQYTKEESRQIASDWFRFHQGKMDLSGMTDAEIKALGREIDRKYEAASEQGKREQEEREARMKTEIRCPKCGSNQLAAGSKGFGLGKAVAGGLLLGPVGLLSGFIGSGQVTLSCLRCGNKWKAGM
jgi:hypothetical protein